MLLVTFSGLELGDPASSVMDVEIGQVSCSKFFLSFIAPGSESQS